MIRTEKAVNTFHGGIDQDTAFNKYDNIHYFDAENMRIISNDATTSGDMSNVVGNTLRMAFASSDVILGFCKIRNNYNDTNKDSMVFFTKNTVSTRCRIYLLEVDPARISGTITMNQAYTVVAGSPGYKSGYIYEDDAGDPLNFDASYPIKAEGRYESANIRKVYWVDNLNNIRYVILDTIQATDPTSIFEINPNVTLMAPTATVDVGGVYTSGIVQYSYQLYIKNGAKTTFSPCSNIVTLSGNDSAGVSAANTGTDLGVVTGKSCIATISNLSTTYNRIRILAVYYTELNVNPVINIVGEIEYDTTSVTFIDNGSTIYGTVPLDEFRTFGQTDYKADSLSSKNNYLFFGNLSKIRWTPTWLDPTDNDFWDSRSVRYRDYSTIVPHVDGQTTASNYAHDGVNITFDRAGADDKMEVVMVGFTGLIPAIPAGQTLTDVTAVVFAGDPGDTVAQGTYDDGGGAGNANYSAIYTDLDAPPFPPGSLSYVAGTDTLTFVIDKTAAFFSTYSAMTDGFIYDMSFTYSYTTVLTYQDAVIEDTIAASITIDIPAGDTPGQWDTAGWIDYETAPTFDGINTFNDISNDGDTLYEFKYQYDLSTLGSSGKNVDVEITEELIRLDENSTEQKSWVNTSVADTAYNTYKRSSMREEVYRLYIVFFNTKMQFSDPQWILDLRMPSVDESSFLDENTEIYARYLFPKVTIKNIPTDDDLLGWQVFRCERKNSDKSVLARGLFSLIEDDAPYCRLYSDNSSPYMFVRAEDVGVSTIDNIVEFIAPEVTFTNEIIRSANDVLKLEGRYSTNDLSAIAGAGVNFYSYYLKTQEVTGVSATDTLTYGIDNIIKVSTTNSDPESLTYTLFSGESLENQMVHNIGGDDYFSKLGTTMLLALDANVTVDAATTGFLLGAYMRDVHTSRYNGITYEARSFNQVIPYSSFTLKATDNITCYYGDTFIQFYTYIRGMLFDEDNDKRFQDVCNIAVETTIDLFRRSDPIQDYIYPRYGTTNCIYGIMEKQTDGIMAFPERYPSILGDLYRYNKVYSQVGNGQLIQCKVFDSNNIESFDTEIIATGLKINNEYYDNWTNLYANNILSLDPRYGPIRSLFTINNTLFSAQDKAIAQISVQERSLIQDNSKTGLTLGTGEVLSRYDYLTTTSGIQSFYDLCITDKSFYYLDRRNKIIYQMTGEGDSPISEVKGYRSFLKSYGTISTVKTGYDPVYKEVFFYISDGVISKNSILNEYTQSFIGKQSFVPLWMFNLNDNFYSIYSSNGYIHNSGSYAVFYGAAAADSTITLIINPNKEVINTYDVLDTRVAVSSGATYYENEQFDHMQVSNSDSNMTFTKALVYGQEPGVTDTTKGLIRQWRTWLIPDDLSQDTIRRMTDSYVKIKLTRHNTGNKKIVLSDVTIYYRPTRN